jgi:thiamine-monophosphate kinase
MNNNNLAALGEFGIISRIAAAARSGTGVITGIGDDAAVTALSPGMQLLTSTDMLLEDVHFCRSWHDPYRLGRKSLAVNISDIAAMGGSPRWATLSLAIPPDLPLDFLDDFTCGFLAMAGEHGVALVGGDTCSSKHGLAVSVTIMGEQQPDRILRRSGARPGDEIWTTGTLGDAAMALKLLERQPPLHEDPHGPKGEGWGEAERILISRLLDPTPRTAAGIALAESELVTAMIDISDGILADFRHIAEQSGVGGIIRLEELPLSPQFRSAAAGFPSFPNSLILAGGEDYELCFTAHADSREKIVAIMKKCGIEAAPVGIVTSSPDVTVLDAAGQPFQSSHQGFNHFAS